jgi:hypothetical protein
MKETRYIKTFESFCLDETMDMFTMPVDPIRSADKVYSSFYKNMKTHVKDFIDKIKNEGKETKEAFNLVVQASRDEIDLTKEQKSFIYKQLGDVLKTIGLTGLTLLPGDILIFMLIKFFKAEKYVFPSSFVPKEA